MLKDAGARHLQHQAYDNEAARTLERRAQVLQSMQGLSHAHAHTGSVTAALEGRLHVFIHNSTGKNPGYSTVVQALQSCC